MVNSNLIFYIDQLDRKSRLFKTANMGAIHGEEEDFGVVLSRYMGKGVQEGWLKSMRQQLVVGGLEGVPKALRNMRDGVLSATKYVVRVGDTASIKGT